MRLDVVSRRRRHPAMTSLIDVIFLLLLFFMLSSTFSKFAEMDISSSNSSAGVSANKPDLFINPSDQGWKINGEFHGETDIEQALVTLYASGKKQAVLQVTDQLAAQKMIYAVELLQNTGITVRVTN